MSQPLVSMLCHRGPVTALAVDAQGRHMATAGMDGEVKVWDLRTYRQLHYYQFTAPPASLDISQRGLLAVGYGAHVTVWKDALATAAQSPYLRHDLPGNAVDTARFRPYEDVLGVGHRQGYLSMGGCVSQRASSCWTYTCPLTPSLPFPSSLLPPHPFLLTPNRRL